MPFRKFTSSVLRKKHLFKILSGLLAGVYVFSLTLPGVVFATQGQNDVAQTQSAKHEPKRGTNPETGKVSFIGDGDPIHVPGVSDVAGMPSSDRALGLANAYGREFGLKNPSQELKLLRNEKGQNGKEITRFQQTYRGVPVLAAELIVNANAKGELLSISGEVSSDLALDTKPAINAQNAERLALSAMARLHQVDEKALASTRPELSIFDESLLTASIRPAELVWNMEVTANGSVQPIREMVLVNAQTGAISFHINQVDTQASTWPVYFDIELDEARGWIYGSDYSGNKIDVISMSTSELVTSFVLVNGAHPSGIALSPDGSELAIAQSGAASILFLNPDTGQTIASVIPYTFPSGNSPYDVIYGRPGRLYSSGGGYSDFIHVIDTNSHTELSRSPNGPSLADPHLEISADKNWLYASRSSGSPQYLYRFDVSTDTLPAPTVMADAPAFSVRTYILDTVDNHIFTDSGQVWTSDLKGNVGATGISGRLAYIPSHNAVAVASSDNNGVVFVSAQNFYPLSTYPVSGQLGSVVAQSDGSKLFVSTSNGMVSIDLSVFPPGTPSTLPTGSLPYADLVLDETRGLLYGSNSTGHKIDVISTSTLQVVDQIRLNNGARPQGMELSPDGNELAVAVLGASSLAFIDTNTRTISATVMPNSAGNLSRPFDVRYGRPGRLYSSGSTSGTDYLHVFDTSTHTEVGISPWPNTISSGPYLTISADKNSVYATESLNTLRLFNVSTDTPTITRGAGSGYRGTTSLLLADNSKIFTNAGQVWLANLTAQIGSFGASGNLVEIPGRGLVAVVSSTTPGLVTFVRTADFYTASTASLPSVSTTGASVASSNGNSLFVNTNTGVKLLDITPTTPSSISPISGSPQTVQVTTSFQQPFKVKVQNVVGEPMAGVLVTFTAPSTSASATFADTNSNVSTAVTDKEGIATSSMFTANNVAGSYVVRATIPNVAIDLQLTNLASVTCTIGNGSDPASLFLPYKLYNCGRTGHGVASGDFNNDGRKDVALTGWGSLLIFLQDSNGNLQQPHAYAGDPSYLAVGDLNGDGLDDIVSIDYYNTIGVYLQRNGGILAYRVTYPTGSTPDAIAVGDVNSDGLKDVVVSHWNSAFIGVFTQNLNGTLNPMVSYPSLTAGYDDIAIGDVNADGRNDVVKMNGAYRDSNIMVYLQNSNGTLNPSVNYAIAACATPCRSTGIAIGDVTGDERSDVVISYGGNRPSSNIAVFPQDVDGSLKPSVSYLAYDIPVPVEIADLDSDNLLDVAILHSAWGRAGTYLQRSDGSLGTESLYVLPYSNSSYNAGDLGIGDVNYDGLPDLLIAGYSGLVILYRNTTIPPTPSPVPSYTPTFTPGPTFTPSATFTPGPGPSRTPGPSATAGPSPTPVPTNSTGSRRTYTAGGAYTIPGSFLCDENQSNCTNGADLDADNAHKYAADTFMFYNTHHHRNSFDDVGGTVVSTVHYGVGYQNAGWTGYQMVYGDGMAADDVVGHEITHGVTQYASNLIYAYQSGAINESFSDIWGEFIDQTNASGNDSASVKWLMGEDTPLGVLRSLSNPPTYGHPDMMSSPYYYDGPYDNGGVHINSGVNNKAAYLMVEGGNFNNRVISGIGLNKTAAVYYEAQMHLLTMGSNYNDLYYALVQGCQNLIGGTDGLTAYDCEQVRLAAEAVEMVIAPPVPATPTHTATATGTATGTPSSTATFTATNTATPSIFTLSLQPDAVAGQDSMIYSGSKTTNFGSAVELGVGEDNNANNRIARSLIRFDLSAIPANATITSATLSLWTSSDLSSTTRTIHVYRLKTAFNESQVTWSRPANGLSWQLAGASGLNDRESTDIGSLSILDNEALNAEKQIVLSPAKIQELVNGTFVNRGFLIAADTEINDRFNYKSSDSATASQRPKLVVQYSLVSATPTHTITPSPTLSPTTTEVSVTPSFTATSTSTATPLPTWIPSTPTPSPTFTALPTYTATATGTATATRTSTATNTFTASPTTASGFPTTVVRDTFNRANGAIGAGWSGYPASFSIASNQLDVVATGSNTFILWNAASFGTDQEAYVTLSQIDTSAGNEHRLILKSQSNKNVTTGLISVRYDAAGQNVQVWTYHSTQGWVQYGASIPVTFVAGDQFGARARPDGTVEVYRNGTLLATRSITTWPYYTNGGYIGLWMVNAPAALLDNFGGGTR